MTTGKVSSWVNRRMLPFVMALGLGAPCLELFMLAASPEVAADSAVLKLRRLGDRVDVVVDGVTTDARVVSESSSATQWSGQLRAAAPLLLRRSQEVDLSEAGLQSIRLSASGSGGLQLTVRAAQGTSLPEPKIQVDGTSLIVSFIRLPIQTTALASGRLDLSRPGRVQQSAFSPPMRARASAPPLGDMAVSSMVLTNRSYVNVDGPPVTLTLNNASAKDALMALARLGGYGFVYLAADQGAAGVIRPSRSSSRWPLKKRAFPRLSIPYFWRLALRVVLMARACWLVQPLPTRVSLLCCQRFTALIRSQLMLQRSISAVLVHKCAYRRRPLSIPPVAPPRERLLPARVKHHRPPVKRQRFSVMDAGREKGTVIAPLSTVLSAAWREQPILACRPLL